ncbi:hypothetical protein [Planococcus beigongshangi]|uniref:hypothetical protein n=1 Tax=Planococcus beigongshangi TaxID=2782536 RepID=UPI00193B03F8|nr:hypothetical protein [Planococcus beigongshangi]
MKIPNFKLKKDERGLSLLEVVASIVILTLLLTSFLGLLLSATKSTKQAREVIDYTFIAQRTMESIYQNSKKYNLEDLDKMMLEEPFTLATKDAEKKFTLNDIDANNESYTIKVTFIDYEPPEKDVFESLSSTLNRVLIEVIPEGKTKPYAKIENLIEWGGS